MGYTLNTGAMQSGYMKITIAGVAATTNGGIASVPNPEGCELGITRAWIRGRTGSTDAANLSVGVGALLGADTSICSTMDCIEATLNTDLTFLPAAQVAETDNPATIWAAAEYLLVTGSASTVGLDADLYIEYMRLED